MDIREDRDYALTFNDARTYIQLNGSGFVTFSKQGGCDTVLWSAPDRLCDYDSYVDLMVSAQGQALVYALLVFIHPPLKYWVM
jgi:hypothetical protein